MPHYKDTQNKLHFLDSVDFAHLLPEGCVQITEDEAEALRPKYVPTYKDLRAQAYPSIADQLDTIFHTGLDGWKEQIQATKDKYPKEVV